MLYTYTHINQQNKARTPGDGDAETYKELIATGLR